MTLPGMAKLIVPATDLALILASASAVALAAGRKGSPGLNQGNIPRASEPARTRATPQAAKARSREFKGSGRKAGDELKAGQAPRTPENIWQKPARPNQKSEMNQTSRRGVC